MPISFISTLFISILSSLFLISCSHKKTQSATAPSPPHPCFTAAAKGDIDFLQKNLETCKTVRSSGGVTTLMLAAARGQDNVINFLISNGMDVNVADDGQDTAINYAVVSNQVGAANLLILSGADLGTKRPDGITVVMMGVQIGSPEMVYALLSPRLAINAKAEDGWTALYFAIRRQDPGVLALLLRQGACKNVVDAEKMSPLDFAKEVGWRQGISILNKAPACGSQTN